MPRLVINPGAPEAWEIELRAGTTTLGRSEENDLPLEHPSVSSAHCQITVTDAGAVLQDLGSTCGTFVGGQLVEEAQLRSGQTFRLGEIEVRFESDAPVPAVAEPPPPVRGAPEVEAIPRAPRLPAPPPPPSPSAPAAAAFCKLHPRIVARYACPKCRYSFCELCVSTRPGGGAMRKYCRTCGTECVAVQAPAAQAPARAASFLSQLGGAFGYPFKGDGLALLGAGTVFYWLIDVALGFSFYSGMLALVALAVLGVLGTGYLTAYLRRILTSSAGGEDQMPDWPDVSEVWSDIVVPFGQLVGTIVACFLPAIAVWLFVARDNPWAGPARVATVVFACGYFPMAFLAVSVFDTVAAVNPLLVIPSVLKIPWAYLLTTVLLGGVFLVHRAGDRLPEVIAIPVLPAIASRFVGLYLMTVMMRMLGLLYRANRGRLGWFNR